MSVEYFVVYTATNKSGEQCVGRIAVTTSRITSIEHIAFIEALISEEANVTGVIITNWRRFEQAE